MSKEKLKDRAAEKQDGRSLTGTLLPRDANGELVHTLIDTHRAIPKNDGGTYTDENTGVMLPTEHRDLHGNKPWLDDPALIELRAIMEDYRTCVKLRVKTSNHRDAVARRMDEMTDELADMFDAADEQIGSTEKHFKKEITKVLKKSRHPVIEAMMGIKGIGPITTAEIITLVNIEEATYASSLWSFCGYAGSSKDRYQKGVKGGGHKHLRTVLYNAAVSMLRAGNEEYRAVYDRRKTKTENSERLVKERTRKSERKNGAPEWKEVPWKDAYPIHRHMDALRIMIKQFLSDLWVVWREIEGLPTNALYVQEQLGHEDITSPDEYGWVWRPEQLKRGNGRKHK